ncbi:MAG: 3-deoxy-7-phosphoheptulonate synthase [Syntrophobacterales bacterium]|nr:3-deoxy-7-phosphoheptulonate synthase [Syntrophobacterales bacterium]
MLIVMKKNASLEEIEKVIERAKTAGFEARPIPGKERTAIGIIGNDHPIDPALFASCPGVKETIPVTKPYKLVSREFMPHDTIIQLGSCAIGGDQNFVVIAGPCAVESETQALSIAHHVKQRGATLFRGGAYKPRTSPYSFQGLGKRGLKILAKVREETGMLIISEALDHELFDIVEEYCDIVQIGARNMQNFSLLRRAGKSKRPVLLKRGMSATVEEWLMAAEYILHEGNDRVILCERGIRTFGDHSRNTLDLSAALFVMRETHLPIIIDPSHASGRRDQVIPLSRAACSLGVHGIMVEVHNNPERALSDGPQSLTFEEFDELMRHLNIIVGSMKILKSTTSGMRKVEGNNLDFENLFFKTGLLSTKGVTKGEGHDTISRL